MTADSTPRPNDALTCAIAYLRADKVGPERYAFKKYDRDYVADTEELLAYLGDLPTGTHARAEKVKNTVQFSGKSYSAAFACPVCGRRRRYNLSFLSNRGVACNGVAFTLVKNERFGTVVRNVEGTRRLVHSDNN